jgi:carnitine 3-dehydrogenase
MNGLPGLQTVGILGGGVIGSGWAARFVINGVDVRLYDIDPEAPRKMSEVLDNARRAYSRMTLAAMPSEGSIAFVATPEETVIGADFVQESAPERLELKQELLARASRAASPNTVFGSSTSGLLPTRLQEKMTHPERLVVGHPFNPVYLLPLVEICGGSQTSQETMNRAKEVYSQIGMKPLMLRKEIDGFVADRLLEALWREALWLVNDGVATAEEIDDAVRYGAGLRWSFMGTFLTYRIAGGEAGMRHFMDQFGPTLKWPWTKLMDVPELTAELLDRIVAQSDVQAAGRSIRELETLRDDCLVAVMQGLRSVGFGAGETLANYEHLLMNRAPKPQLTIDEPTIALERTIPAEWTDYNGHTNDSRYAQASSEACDNFFRGIGFDAAYLASGRTFYTVESHVRYLEQTRAGDHIQVRVQVVGLDRKKIHLFTDVVRTDGVIAATAEHLFIHIDTSTQKSSPIGDEIFSKIVPIAAAHGKLPMPEGIGRRVGERLNT